jgi:hypothetical protein
MSVPNVSRTKVYRTKADLTQYVAIGLYCAGLRRFLDILWNTQWDSPTVGRDAADAEKIAYRLPMSRPHNRFHEHHNRLEPQSQYLFRKNEPSVIPELRIFRGGPTNVHHDQ